MEGLPLVSVESQACGTPKIVSKVGGNPESIKDGETGFSATPGSPSSLAKKIRILRGNENLRNRMSKSAKKYFQKSFSMEYIKNQYVDLYKED